MNTAVDADTTAGQHQDVAGTLDALLDVETMFENSGWDDGYKDGVRVGLLEGRAHGCSKGLAFGLEVGFYAGVADVWSVVAASAPTTANDAHKDPRTQQSNPSQEPSPRISDRAVRQIDLLVEATSKFPRQNCRDTDLNLELDRLRGRHRTVMTLLHVDPSLAATSFRHIPAAAESQRQADTQVNVFVSDGLPSRSSAVNSTSKSPGLSF